MEKRYKTIFLTDNEECFNFFRAELARVKELDVFIEAKITPSVYLLGSSPAEAISKVTSNEGSLPRIKVVASIVIIVVVVT